GPAVQLRPQRPAPRQQRQTRHLVQRTAVHRRRQPDRQLVPDNGPGGVSVRTQARPQQRVGRSWISPMPSPRPAYTLFELMVVEATLPIGVRFRLDESGQASVPGLSPATSGGGDSGQWHPVALFLPDGTAQEDREIVFASTGSRPVSVKLRALTGAVTVRALP